MIRFLTNAKKIELLKKFQQKMYPNLVIAQLLAMSKQRPKSVQFLTHQQNYSLNDCLYSRPNKLSMIFDILLRFRTNMIA